MQRVTQAPIEVVRSRYFHPLSTPGHGPQIRQDLASEGTRRARLASRECMVMTDTRDEQLGVRELARQGTLAAYIEQATENERRRLRADGYELLYPLVFVRLTRRFEAQRGHRDCMVSVSGLRPDCLDRFHDDMDAILDDLFRNARIPIRNIEGWVSRRMIAVTIDAYRRRRGERGALQRPRTPRWLAQELRHNSRLMEVAVEMLEWVGLDATAGAYDWPIEAWAAQRVGVIGDYDSACRSVVQDIAAVIAAMRTRPKWYANYVERPMGRKRPPLVIAHQDSPESPPHPAQAVLAAHVADDARRAELAALAVAVISARAERGHDIRAVVIEVISTLFGSGTGSEDLDRLPGYDPGDDERVDFCLADPETVDRIVAVVLDLLAERE